MRKYLGACLAIGALSFGSNAYAQQGGDSFDVTAETQAGITVTCGQNLDFGIISVPASNTEAVITVDQSSGSSAVSDNPNVVVTGGSEAQCTISQHETGTSMTAALSADSGTPGEGTLDGLLLADNGNTLSADLVLSEHQNIDASGVEGADLFIGGALTVPADHTDFGTYTATVNLVVTE